MTTDHVDVRSTRSIDRPGGRRWGLLALAVALGMSWFAVVWIARLLEPLHSFSAEWWPTASIWRLVVGCLLYLVVVPIAWRRFFPDSWARITGLRAPTTRAQWLWTLAILVAVLVPSLAFVGGVGKLSAALATPVLIFAALQPPVVEEVLMRGLFVTVCERGGYGPLLTTLVGTAVFTVWHVVSFDLTNGLITGLFSIPFFYVTRYLTGTTLVPIVIHLVANAGAFNGFASWRSWSWSSSRRSCGSSRGVAAEPITSPTRRDRRYGARTVGCPSCSGPSSTSSCRSCSSRASGSCSPGASRSTSTASTR